MKYTKVPPNLFKHIQINVGVLTKTFTPATGTIGDLLGGTSGGVTFNATPTYVDFGEDVDNCPKNMKELKKLDSWEAKVSGTFIEITTSMVKSLLGAADVDSSDSTKIVPRNEILDSDFEDLWWVGDYSDVNSDSKGTPGYVAIHLMNALSTDGFQIKSSDKAKSQFTFNYTAHYAMTNKDGEDTSDVVPFEIYVKAGSST